MENLDLYALAEENRVEVCAHSLPLSKSVSFAIKGDYYALIDPLQLDCFADERVHLGHELGHCITGSFYNPYAALDIRAQHERRAVRWAIRYLVPLDKLLCCVKQGITEAWDLAEAFNVPTWFMGQAMEYYRDDADPILI
jgi:hypothetical protein